MRIRRGARLAALAAGLSLCGCRGLGRPNVLLIVIDTARADRFTFDGYRRDTSPEIAALAREGAVYERAYTPAPWTLPAHASLFTGLYPSAHGADSGHLWLDDERVTLAEALRDAGYRTLGFIGNPCIGSLFNFQQGFDTYDEVWRRVRKETGDMGAGLTNEAVERWLAWRDANPEARRQPFFIFINYVEPHLPYEPPDPERARFLSPSADRAAVERLRALRHPEEDRYILGLRSLSDADLAVLSDLYDGEIAYADRRVGEIAALLRRLGLLDDTLVVVTSDHGEEIGEHHYLDHKMNVYEPLLHVPLVLRYPRAVRGGQRIRGPVMLQDLFPTILGLAGARPPDPPGGTPARGPREAVPLPGVAGAGGPGRGDAGSEPIIAEFARPLPFVAVLDEVEPGRDHRGWDHALVAYRTGDLKLHWSSGGRHRLFDLRSDPGEDRDLAALAPDRAAALAREVAAWLSRPGARPPVGFAGHASPIPPGHGGPAFGAPDARIPPIPGASP
jgi:arylsulfatase A-like enzyme